LAFLDNSMVFRKKLITPKVPNQAAALVHYAKRHRVFVKKLIDKQIIQQNVQQTRFRNNGEFLFFSLGVGIMTPNHVESVRRILIRRMYRLLRIWLRIRFTGMITNKPKEVRMGKGKGTFTSWCKAVSIGSPIFEISFAKRYPSPFLFYFFHKFRAKFTVPVGLIERFRYK
jgi:ribosomal protein L16/L10AE